VGNPSTVTATFSPQTILDQSVGLLRPALRQKGISFNTHCPGSLPEALVGDPIRLQNVILSLLTNAIDSTEAGRITLAVSSEVISDRAWLTLTVTDTGCGIPADKLPTLFDAFTRVTPAYTSPTGGMGLSLTLTKAYLDRIGGTINVTSEVGKGSTVTVKAPFAVSSDAPPVPNAAAVTPPKMPPAQSRLLLVEDELITQEVLRGQFTRLGCEVTLAETVADALAAVREQDYDWVLTDIGLPDGDGIGLTRTLRADPRCQALPIIGHSAHIDAAGQQEALEAGMQEIHQKPLPEAERARLVAQYGGGRMTLSGDKR
jgi:CheY-like chemotaxis protein/anti-sigma regulatory factor (Ser/Thr protein kinase)